MKKIIALFLILTAVNVSATETSKPTEDQIQARKEFVDAFMKATPEERKALREKAKKDPELRKALGISKRKHKTSK